MTQWFRLDTHRQRAVGAARLPTGPDEDWILAAVHHDDIGLAAWRRLRGGVDVGALPDAHGRLAPLVFETLSRSGVDDPLVPELARARLVHLTLARRLKATVGPVVSGFIDEDIDVMVLKGAALLDVYGTPARRPMVDVDLLVRPRQIPEAVRVLAAHGLTSAVDVRQPVKVACRHSESFLSVSGSGNIDLHWMASPQLAPPGTARAQWRRPWYTQLDDDEFWSRARPIQFGEVSVLAPSTTDLLLLTILHGVRFGISDDTRWAVDAATILRHCADEVDWDLLVDLAVRHRVIEVTNTALRYLIDRILVGGLTGIVPAGVMVRLGSARRSWRERVIDRLSEWEHGMRPGTPRLLVDLVVRQMAFTAHESIVMSVRSFPWFLALWTGVDRPRRMLAVRRRLGASLERRSSNPDGDRN